MELILGRFLGILVVSAIGALVWALLLQPACSLVLKFKPSYFAAYKASLMGAACNGTLGFVVGLIVALLGKDVTPNGYLILVGVGFCLNVISVQWLVKRPDKTTMRLDQAGFVALAQLAILVAIFGSIALLVHLVTS